MAQVATFINDISEFGRLTQGRQVRLLAYYLHTREGKSRFTIEDIARLYVEARYASPKNLNQVLINESSAKRLLRDQAGYYLTAPSEQKLESEFPGIKSVRPASQQASTSLRNVIVKVTSPVAVDYLEEAVTCFESQCFRASIVMSWAVCFDHLLDFIWGEPGRLSACNAYLSARKLKIRAITNREDFQELKESEVLDMCRIADITGKALSKTLKRCLDTRNDYAHPSGLQISVSKAESYIEDIVNNAILKL